MENNQVNFITNFTLRDFEDILKKMSKIPVEAPVMYMGRDAHEYMTTADKNRKKELLLKWEKEADERRRLDIAKMELMTGRATFSHWMAFDGLWKRSDYNTRTALAWGEKFCYVWEHPTAKILDPETQRYFPVRIRMTAEMCSLYYHWDTDYDEGTVEICECWDPNEVWTALRKYDKS